MSNWRQDCPLSKEQITFKIGDACKDEERKESNWEDNHITMSRCQADVHQMSIVYKVWGHLLLNFDKISVLKCGHKKNLALRIYMFAGCSEVF